jgi:hypothetical protein
MAGEVKRLIEELMRVRSKGNPALEPFVRVHLILNGIHPDEYTADSPSDPDLEQTLEKMIADFRGNNSDGAS